MRNRSSFLPHLEKKKENENNDDGETRMDGWMISPKSGRQEQKQSHWAA